jgi:SAM-dependent methyltransferase
MPVVMNEWNLQSFSGLENGRAHRADAGLFPAERAILDLLGQVPSGDVLDLGVGTGRTVPFLFPQARTYVGIDYARAAIEEARTNFPEADLRVMDARDLSAFADSSFDLVLFGYNGICGPPEDHCRGTSRAASRRLVRVQLPQP